MKKIHALLISLILVLFLANNITLFSILDTEVETVTISRVIDGDTIVLTDERTIRLANVNAPEKNSQLSKLAINYLKKYENKSVEIEILEEDLYNRFVARIFSSDYINKDLVSLGFASKAWVYDEEKEEFAKSEERAIENQKGIWVHSEYWNCFNIGIEAEEEIVKIKNLCKINMNGFYIKDESRKTYKFLNISNTLIELHTGDGNNTKDKLYWSSGNVWNDDRDTAYLFDKEDRIAGYYSYGY